MIEEETVKKLMWQWLEDYSEEFKKLPESERDQFFEVVYTTWLKVSGKLLMSMVEATWTIHQMKIKEGA